MCSNCKNVLIGFSIPHKPFNCPLHHSSYCSICCSYGHLTENCPDDEVVKHRQVEYVEQLVAPSLLQRYKICSKTPLPGPAEPLTLHEPEWEVENSEKTIRQILMNHGIQPLKPKENRRLMKQIADDMQRKLVYIDVK